MRLNNELSLSSGDGSVVEVGCTQKGFIYCATCVMQF